MRAVLSLEVSCRMGVKSRSECFSGQSPNRAKLDNPVRGRGEAEPLLLLSSRNSSYSSKHDRTEQYRTDRVQQPLNTCSTPVQHLLAFQNITCGRIINV